MNVTTLAQSVVAAGSPTAQRWTASDDDPTSIRWTAALP
jgi:hypothetical protein